MVLLEHRVEDLHRRCCGCAAAGFPRSSLSLKTSAPMRSFCCSTRQAASAAASAAVTDFMFRTLPKNIVDALIDEQQRGAFALFGEDAAVGFAQCAAVTFQSICRMSSPSW